ncbi:hypothetical protein [Paenibacillus sp. YN15]|uniref:hypothetical protein n=1 Tax=Paenibacillus sp. YN15 TaxID=1742774 RepID=UPI0015EC9AE4|nr:hypothetical protein [Paenibacillus sp. YN15]
MKFVKGQAGRERMSVEERQRRVHFGGGGPGVGASATELSDSYGGKNGDLDFLRN